MKSLILLAGCGLGDGSCIEETVLIYTVLDKYHLDYTPVAEATSIRSVNHITEQPEENRHLLKEAARIGRGKIQALSKIKLDEYDALLTPGGMGLLVNYRGSDAVKACVEHFIRRKKPIGTMCAGLDFFREILGKGFLQEEVKELTAQEYVCDCERNIFYTPAFRKTGNCYDMLQGIDAMIGAMKNCVEKP